MVKTYKAFTIVELLIVIVVIAVLAAISFVAYNGIQNRAADSVVQHETAQMYKRGQATMIEGAAGENDHQATIDYLNMNFKPSVDSSYGAELYPLMVWGDYTYSNGGYEQIGYNVMALSKSGRVFSATGAKGGVSRAMTEWDDIIQEHQQSIDYYTEEMSQPDSWCNEDTGCQEALEDYRLLMQEAIARRDRGEDMWTVHETSPDCFNTLPYAFSGYVYSRLEQGWIFADGCTH